MTFNYTLSTIVQLLFVAITICSPSRIVAQEGENTTKHIKDILATPGCCNAEAYYNIGTLYLEQEKYGHAKVYLLRAQHLSPQDPDVKYNLTILNDKIKTNFIALPQNEFLRGVHNVLSYLPYLVWSILAVLTAIWLLYLLYQIMMSKFSYFPLAALIASGILLIVSLLGIANRTSLLGECEKAVVVQQSPLYSAASDRSKEGNELKPGDEVILIDSIQDYYKVETVSLDQGYIAKPNVHSTCINLP